MQPIDQRLLDLRDSLPGTVLRGSGNTRAYYLRERIGEGGQGWVFTANWDDPGGVVVIVKVLRPDAVSRDSLARFQTEAEVLRRLSQGSPNPHVVRFFDHAVHHMPSPLGGDPLVLPFTVLEYVHGVTLEQVLGTTKARGLPLERVRRIGRQVSAALASVHAQKVVHRDLKPSNILLSSESGAEVAKVTDFGLVKVIEMGVSRTATLAGASLGYAPPEQYEHGNKRVSVATDVFSLAAILFEMLTGRLAFPFRENENPLLIITRILTVERPKLTGEKGLSAELVGRGGILDKLDAHFARALSADPKERHQSVQEFWSSVEPLFVMALEAAGVRMGNATGGVPPGVGGASGGSGAYPVGQPAHPQQGQQPHQEQHGQHASPAPGAARPSRPPASSLADPSVLPFMETAPAFGAANIAKLPTQSSEGNVPPQRASHAAPSPTTPAGGASALSSSGPQQAPQPPRGSGHMAAAAPVVTPGRVGSSPPRSGGRTSGAPPAVWHFRVVSPPLQPGIVRAAAFSADGQGAVGVGPGGLARWDRSWYAMSLPTGVDPRLVQGITRLRSGDVLLLGERGLAARMAPTGVHEHWAMPDREVTFFGVYADERSGSFILVGDRPARGGAATIAPTVGYLAQVNDGRANFAQEVKGTQRLRDATRIVSGLVLACGDMGALVRFDGRSAELLANLCGGNLFAIEPLADGGALTVGGGGHALYVSARFSAQLEPVQTTRDLACVCVADDGSAWAGAAQARLLRRQGETWVRQFNDVPLASSILAVWASSRTVRAICDDGAVIEGNLS